MGIFDKLKGGIKDTEIKMIYDVKTKKFNVAYQYKEICSAKTNISAGEVFMNWVTAKKNEST